MPEKQFDENLSETERNAWFLEVLQELLRKYKTAKDQDIVQDLLTSYRAMGCNMNLKIPYPDSHLKFFQENLDEASYEHGERFHQDILFVEKWYQGSWTSSIFADYCWTLKTVVPDAEYRPKS
jgi:hypothetical protein